jgi:hypothetical protein
MYIVVRHKNDPQQTYTNVWTDSGVLKAITTPNNVADLLKIEKANGRRILVHRCGLGTIPHRICCSLEIDQIARIDQRDSYITFLNPLRVDDDPSHNPGRGENYY